MRTVKKRAFLFAVSAAMLLTYMPGIWPGTAVYAAEGDYVKTTTNTWLGTGKIGSPTKYSGNYVSEKYWNGYYVYYGKYENIPVKYRVLAPSTTDFGGHTMLLDCDRILKYGGFRSNEDAVDASVWAASDIKAWLNGSEFLYNTGVFTTDERNAIASSTKAEKAAGDGWGYSDLKYTPLTGEQIFVLDAAEATRTDYGYLNTDSISFTRKKPSNSDDSWWLRSQSNDASSVGYADGYGINDNIASLNYNFGISPAFNVDLSSVLFSTRTSNHYYFKLTLKSDSMTAGLQEDANVTLDSDGTITVPYTVTGSAEQVSLLITDKPYTETDANILDYGKLDDVTVSSGTGTFTPTPALTGTWGTDYHVYILAEDVNGDVETDYASEPVEISVTTLTGTCGDNAAWTYYPATGDLMISGTGAMNDYNAAGQPWNDFRSNITSVDIGDGITSVGSNAFYDCSSLSSITIPESAAGIGTDAFGNCASLTGLTYGGSALQWEALTGGADLGIPAGCTKTYLKKDVFIDGNITNGSVTVNKTGFSPDEEVILTVTPDVGFGVQSVSINGTAFTPDENGTYSFTMPAENVTVTAEFIVNNFKTLQALIYAAVPDGIITLDRDYTAVSGESALGIPADKTITIDLNGHTIDRGLAGSDAVRYGYVIEVNGDLTLTDSSDGQTGKITGGNNLYEGGGVCVNGAFTMTGGTISGNHAADGGGVSVGGSFTMIGGEISDNTATDGGGVSVFKTFTMTGGMISSNNAYNGGGVSVWNTFIITGGTISGNTSVNLGNDVHFEKYSTFYYKNGAEFNVTFVLDPRKAKCFNSVEMTDTEHGTITPSEGTLTVLGETYYVEGVTVILTVTPDTEYSVRSVSVNGTALKPDENGTYSFTMPGEDVTVTAEFEAIDYNISITAPVNGTITAKIGNTSATTAHYGDTVTLDVTPNTGCVAKRVSVNGTAIEPVNGVYSFTMPAKDVTVTATFATNVDLATLDGDYTAQDGDVLTGSTSYMVTIDDGAGITLSDATVNGGIVCEGTAEITIIGTNSVTGAWGNAGIQIGGSLTTLTIKGDGELTAIGGGRGAGIGLSRVWNYDGYVSSGDIVIEGGTITAIGGGWGAGIGTGVIKNTNNDSSTTVQFGNVTIKGGTVTAIGGDSGEGIGKGYSYPGPIFEFGTLTIYDSIDKVESSSIRNNDRVVYMHEDTDVTASASDYFTIIEDGDRRSIEKKDDTDYTITIADGIEHGTITAKIGDTSATTAHYGDTVTLDVIPDADYSVKSVSVNGGAVTLTDNNNGTYSFTMPGEDVAVTAEFEAIDYNKDYNINITAPANGTITAKIGDTSATTAHYGDTVTLTVTPNAGYVFNTLTWDGTNVDKSDMTINDDGSYTYSFTMPAEDVTVSAKFLGEHSFTALQALINQTDQGDTLTLNSDYITESGDDALVIPAGKTITIDLNGHTIDRRLSGSSLFSDGYVIKVEGDLTLTDSSEGQTGKITGGSNSGEGGGVIVDYNGSFTMTGGTISGNSAGFLTEDLYVGGGVLVNGTFVMAGGSISGNEASIGGGVVVGENGTFTMTGGTISGNRANVSGGVFAGGPFVMTGGTISGNTAQVSGGADGSGTFYLKNGVEVSDVEGTVTHFGSVTISNTVHGTITPSDGTLPVLDKNYYVEDKPVTLTVTPDAGYALSSLTVRDADNKEIEVINNQFTMPESDVTVTAEFKFADGIGAKLAGYSLSLDGDIGVNFYMELDDDVSKDPSTYMHFILPDGSTSDVYLTDTDNFKKDTTTVPGKTYYVFKCNVAAKEMNAPIKAQIISGDRSGEEYTYTVKEYADYILQHSDNAYLKTLARAMLDYGSAAQDYFIPGSGTLPNPDYADSISSVTAGTINKPYNVSTEVMPEDESIVFDGATLTLQTETTISLYFTGEFDLDQTTFTAASTNYKGETVTYEIEKTANKTYKIIRIKGIKAEDIGKDITVTINGNYHVTYSPMNYCYNVINKETHYDVKLVNVCKALYNYWQAANSYQLYGKGGIQNG